MDRDELEFLISQHFDGTLDEAESVRLRVHLASDMAARSLFDEHAKLDAALRGSRSVLAIDEAWLSAQIADHIDEANAKPLKIGAGRWSFAPLAMAAALMIGLTLGVIFLKDDDKPITPVAQETNAMRSEPVTVIALGDSKSNAAKPQAAGYASVSVGVPANLTPQIVSALYLSRDLGESRVNIRAAGHRSADAFD